MIVHNKLKSSPLFLLSFRCFIVCISNIEKKGEFTIKKFLKNIEKEGKISCYTL